MQVIKLVHTVKDITLHFPLFDFVRKSILYAKITLSHKKFVSKLVVNKLHAFYFPIYCVQLNHNVTIQSVSNVKLLGVNIDVELNFNHHIA